MHHFEECPQITQQSYLLHFLNEIQSRYFMFLEQEQNISMADSIFHPFILLIHQSHFVQLNLKIFPLKFIVFLYIFWLELIFDELNINTIHPTLDIGWLKWKFYNLMYGIITFNNLHYVKQCLIL